MESNDHFMITSKLSANNKELDIKDHPQDSLVQAYEYHILIDMVYFVFLGRNPC